MLRKRRKGGGRKPARRIVPLDVSGLPPTERPLPESRPMRFSAVRAGDRRCRWPMGNPKQPEFRFCGADCTHGMSYCPTHWRMSVAE